METAQNKPTRNLRVSGHKDYIAVDILDAQGKVLETPLYLRKGEIKRIFHKEEAVDQFFETEITIDDTFTFLNCKSVDIKDEWRGAEWPAAFTELLDENIVKFKTLHL